MIPLSGDRFPTTPDELAAALERGFTSRGVTPRSIVATGESLAVDLTGATLSRGFRVPTTPADAAPQMIPRVEIRAEPLHFEKTPLTLRIEADEASVAFAGTPEDGALLLTGTKSGTVSISATRKDLESLLDSLAKEAASRQGAEVKSTRLELTQRGPRALSFRVEVAAKMFIMRASLSLTGNLDVDDALVARISGLALDGDAMITKLVGSFVRPQLDKLEGRAIPLLAFAPPALRLRDIELTAGETLEIRAKLGAAA